MVQDEYNPRIEHIPCRNKPLNIDEDKYIFVYRKQQACIRHEVYKILKKIE